MRAARPGEKPEPSAASWRLGEIINALLAPWQTEHSGTGRGVKAYLPDVQVYSQWRRSDDWVKEFKEIEEQWSKALRGAGGPRSDSRGGRFLQYLSALCDFELAAGRAQPVGSSGGTTYLFRIGLVGVPEPVTVVRLATGEPGVRDRGITHLRRLPAGWDPKKQEDRGKMELIVARLRGFAATMATRRAQRILKEEQALAHLYAAPAGPSPVQDAAVSTSRD
ncbi:MAG: hypothetical protein MO847_03885 [Candidatus Protistobacter heckmanni]|nr:hypothetical protein [Candidatus Protistobacter heckmanni]